MGEKVQGREKSMCKGPEAGVYIVEDPPGKPIWLEDSDKGESNGRGLERGQEEARWSCRALETTEELGPLLLPYGQLRGLEGRQALPCHKS